MKRLCDCGCCCQLSPSFSLINNIINFEQFSFMRFCCTSTHTHTRFGISESSNAHMIVCPSDAIAAVYFVALYNIYEDSEITTYFMVPGLKPNLLYRIILSLNSHSFWLAHSFYRNTLKSMQCLTCLHHIARQTVNSIQSV